MKKGLIATALIAATIGLAGCSGSDTQTAKSSPAPTATSASASPTVKPTSVAPAPTPTTWSTPVAQHMYLAYVKPLNAALANYTKVNKSDPSAKKFKKACRLNATALSTFARQLAQGSWPSATQKYVDAQINAVTKERSGWLNCANADSLSDAQDATYQIYDSSRQAERTRIALGLPSAN